MPRDISSDNCIQSYFHCRRCVLERPKGFTGKKWPQLLEVGFTPIGLQVWCKRHNLNIAHIDFEGQQHPANLEG